MQDKTIHPFKVSQSILEHVKAIAAIENRCTSSVIERLVREALIARDDLPADEQKKQD